MLFQEKLHQQDPGEGGGSRRKPSARRAEEDENRPRHLRSDLSDEGICHAAGKVGLLKPRIGWSVVNLLSPLFTKKLPTGCRETSGSGIVLLPLRVPGCLDQVLTMAPIGDNRAISADETLRHAVV